MCGSRGIPAKTASACCPLIASCCAWLNCCSWAFQLVKHQKTKAGLVRFYPGLALENGIEALKEFIIISFVVEQKGCPFTISKLKGKTLNFLLFLHETGIILLRIRDQSSTGHRKNQFRYYGISALWFYKAVKSASGELSYYNTDTIKLK